MSQFESRAQLLIPPSQLTELYVRRVQVETLFAGKVSASASRAEVNQFVLALAATSGRLTAWMNDRTTIVRCYRTVRTPLSHVCYFTTGVALGTVNRARVVRHDAEPAQRNSQEANQGG